MVVPRSQKGMSLFSWMVLIAVVAFFASFAFKVIPHYIDNRALDKAIVSIGDGTSDIRDIRAFKEALRKRALINAIDLKEDEVKVVLENNEYLVKLKYERREPLIKNIDLVVSFDKEYRVRMP